MQKTAIHVSIILMQTNIIINLVWRYSDFTHTHAHTDTHKGIEGWINASQASLASCCSSGKTGRVRQEGETAREEVR